MPREFLLTERLFKLLSSRCGILVCSAQRCGKPLRPNDKIVSSGATGRRHCRRFHKECYEELFIDV